MMSAHDRRAARLKLFQYLAQKRGLTPAEIGALSQGQARLLYLDDWSELEASTISDWSQFHPKAHRRVLGEE